MYRRLTAAFGRRAGSGQPGVNRERESGVLKAIKVVHTIAWAFFAACIIAIPVVSWRGEQRAATWLAAIVLAEVVVLAINHWRCPLTLLAARYTDDRRANFDICLPAWLARYNKHIFGPLYVAGIIVALANWACQPRPPGCWLVH